MSQNDFYHFECPHCKSTVIVQKNELNCCIFRHGVLKRTGQQIPPHSPKTLCDSLASTGQIYGCGKPFRVIFDSSQNLQAVICDYI